MTSLTVSAAGFEAEDLRVVAGLACDVARAQDFLEGAPSEGVAKVGVEGDVDAGLRPARGAAGTVE